MKIAYVFPAFPVRSQSFAISELQALGAAGAQVHAYSLERWPVAGFDLAGIELRQLPHGERLRAVFSLHLPALLWFCLRNAASLREFLRSAMLAPAALAIARRIGAEGYDVVHLFWAHYPALVARALHSIAPRRRWLTSSFCGAYDLTGGYGLSAWSVRHADVVLSHCEDSARLVQHKYQRQAEVFYRGVNLADAGGAGERNRVLIASRLTRNKRVDLAIAAFGELRRHLPQAELVIAGDGPQRRELEQLAAAQLPPGSFRFLGFIPNQQLLGLYAGALLLLVASESPSERLPNVIKEAMMLGCVPVSSRTRGIDELISHNVDGFIVDFNDNLRASMKEVARRSLADAASLRRCARLKAEHRFDNRAIARNKLQLWSRIHAART